jgi:hypothetical protein
MTDHREAVAEPYEGQTFAPGLVSRLRCVHCGTQQRHHGADLRCPVMYRPETLEAAREALAAAVSTNDAAAEFVARGEVQRLGGDPDADDCAGCGRPDGTTYDGVSRMSWCRRCSSRP